MTDNLLSQMEHLIARADKAYRAGKYDVSHECLRAAREIAQQLEMATGTWFYKQLGVDVFELWQETEYGPKKIGIIYDHPSIDFICERLNQKETAD